MPIPVVCGSCQVNLRAPDAAAGKKVKCKNCQAIIAVPIPVLVPDSDFEFVDPASLTSPKPVAAKQIAAAPIAAKSEPFVFTQGDDDEKDEAPRKPLKKSKRVAVEDDEEDEAPRKSAKKSKLVVDEDDGEEEAPRKGKKKAIIADDDADEAGEDEAPKKRKGKKAAKKKSNPMIFVLGGVGAVFALGFLGVMIW